MRADVAAARFRPCPSSSDRSTPDRNVDLWRTSVLPRLKRQWLRRNLHRRGSSRVSLAAISRRQQPVCSYVTYFQFSLVAGRIIVNVVPLPCFDSTLIVPP